MVVYVVAALAMLVRCCSTRRSPMTDILIDCWPHSRLLVVVGTIWRLRTALLWSGYGITLVGWAGIVESPVSSWMHPRMS